MTEPKADTTVRLVAADSQAELRSLFIELAREAGADDPEQAGCGRIRDGCSAPKCPCASWGNARAGGPSARGH
jgi:hypothetical protein